MFVRGERIYRGKDQTMTASGPSNKQRETEKKNENT